MSNNIPTLPVLKRPFDFFLSLIGLILCFPFFVIIPILIKLDDGGKILFTQKRWGKNKSNIKVYKFRTMKESSATPDYNLQASRNDPRITKIGALLRVSALDELPQLINIFLGQMSFVGPRVLPINEVQNNEGAKYKYTADNDIPGFDYRSGVKPGLTGIAQIYAPRDISRRNKFRYDSIYIRNMSLCLDIKLIVYSVILTLLFRWNKKRHKEVIS